MITKRKIVLTYNKWRSHFDILAFLETKWFIFMGTQITKIDDGRIGLNLNPKYETKERRQ
jgi:hypothetical protein